MHLATVNTHEITILNQFHITTAEISPRLTWILNLLTTKMQLIAFSYWININFGEFLQYTLLYIIWRFLFLYVFMPICITRNSILEYIPFIIKAAKRYFIYLVATKSMMITPDCVHFM